MKHLIAALCTCAILIACKGDKPLLEPGRDGIVLTLSFDKGTDLVQVSDALHRRLRDAGARASRIQTKLPSDVLVEVLGVKDGKRVQVLLQIQGALEVRAVLEDNTVFVDTLDSAPATIRSSLELEEGDRQGPTLFGRDEEALKTWTASIAKANPAIHVALSHPGKLTVAYALSTQAALTSRHVESARVKTGEEGDPIIAIALTESGAKAFEALTAASVTKRIAILVDGTVFTAPVVMEPIPGGRLQVTLSGMYTQPEMMALSQLYAAAIRTPLPAKPTVRLGP